MPIKDSSGDNVIGVAQVINKLNCERFTENDEKVSIVIHVKPENLLFFRLLLTLIAIYCPFRYFRRICSFVELA